MNGILNGIRNVLSLTAWEMEVPKAYGPLHLSFFIIGLAVSLLLAWKLRKVGDRGNRAVLLTVGIFLVVCEVYKQLMYEVVLEPEPGYRWGNFSFHLCSIPMYLCLIIPMLKPGRVQKALYSFLMTFNLLSGFIAFFEPSGLLHGHWTLTMHALVWHMMLVFLGVYIALSGRGCNDKKDFKDAIVVFIILCAIAFGLNCAFWEVSNGELNNFFVGPRNSSLIVFKQISEMFGWYVSTALYIPATTLGAFVLYLLFRFVNKKVNAPKLTAV